MPGPRPSDSAPPPPSAGHTAAAEHRALFDVLAAAAAVIEADGRVEAANPRAARAAGVDGETLVGTPFWEGPWWAHAEAAREAVRDAVERAAAGDAVHRILRMRDGDAFVDVDAWFHPLSVSLAGPAGSRGGPARVLFEGRPLARAEAGSRTRDVFFDISHDLLAIVGLDGYIRQANPAWTDVLGHPRGDLDGRTYADFVHPDDLAQARAAFDRMRQGEAAYDFETRLRHRDGSYRWIAWTCDPSEEGLVYCSGRDVTERRAAYEALQQSETLLSGVMDSSLDGIMAFEAVRDDDGRIVDFLCLMANPHAGALTGRSEKDFVGRCLLEELPGNREEGLFDAYVHVTETGEPYSRELYYAHDDIEQWFELTAVRLGDGFTVTFQDVTEERVARETWMAMAAAHMGTWDIDLATDLVRRTGALDELFGYAGSGARTLEEYLERVHPDDRDRVEEALAFSTREGREHYVEYRVVRPDGTTRWVASRGDVVADGDRARRLVGAVTDITERKDAEEALIEADRQQMELLALLESLLANAPVGFAFFDRDGRVARIDDTLAALNARAPEACLGRPAYDLAPFCDPDVGMMIEHVFQSGKPVSNVEVHHEADGGARTWLVSYFAVAPRDTPLYVGGMVVDITEQKQAQSRLAARERQQAAAAELGQQALRHADLQAVMDAAVQTVAEVLDTDFTKVLELRPGEEHLLLQAGIGWREGLVGTARVEAGYDSQAGFTLRTNEPVIVHDVATDERFERSQLFTEHGVVSGMSVVILGGERPYGVLGTHTRTPRRFTEQDAHFLRTVANVLGEAVERWQKEEALRTSAAEFRGTFENAAVGMAHVDLDGSWLRVNQRLCDIVGYERAELLERTFQDLTHPDDLDADVDRFERLKRGEVDGYQIEKRYFRKDGSVVWIGLTTTLQRDADGAPLYCISIVQDIDDRKTAEAALRASEMQFRTLAETLEQRVRERTAELEHTNQELDQFAYVASHDLKAPLRAIDNLAAWVMEDVGDALPEPSQRHLAKLQERAKRMERLLEDLLTYSRVGRRQYPAEEVDVRALVEDIAELLDPPAEFRIQIDDLPTLTSPRPPLEMVLRNLMSNAVKHHGGDEGCIRVSARDQGALVEFVVADDGPGIEPAFHERIFQMFETLRPRDEVEGSGMGLAVVKKAVQSAGGTVRLESRPGEGTTFLFTWPKEPPH